MERETIFSQRASILSRLWAKTRVEEPSGCWVWRGARSGVYGSITIAGQKWVISRLSMTLTHGRIFDRKTLACHTCDNPPCWNPDHLFPGTVQDNNADRHHKGRTRTAAGLPWSQAEYAYRMYWIGKCSMAAIARALGVRVAVVDSAIQRVERASWQNEDRLSREAESEAFRSKKAF